MDDKAKIKALIEKRPDLIPYVLECVSNHLRDFEERAKKQNNALLREALGDAVHILGLKRKPKDMHLLCTRIKRAIFPTGITMYHHQGEKNFYERYFKDE